ncbi:MAG: NAD(+)/NADH kinase [Promethearchaeota archaeon]
MKNNYNSIDANKEIENNLPIAIACRLDKQNALDLVKKIIEYLKKKNIKFVLENRIAHRFSPHFRKELSKMNEKTVKIILSIGGDGTVLRVCQNLPRKDPAPIFGINIDSVGFLDDFDLRKNDLYNFLDDIINNNYIIEKSFRLATFYNKNRLKDALNEVYIVSSKLSKVLHISIKIDGMLYNNAYLDGVIISTSVGSTAYCLSAGGALLDPRLKAIQIVPVNPFAGSGALKPIVIPSSSTIEIELLRPRLNAIIIIDGQMEYKATPKSIIRVRRSESDIKFARLKNSPKNFYNKLRTKLLYGVHVPEEDSPEE